MSMVTTDAWVLYPGGGSAPVSLVREEFSFPDISDHEVLAEPLYGCWEGNMAHALERRPIDVCRERGEDRVVLGNSGVVRVLRVGPAVTTVRPGDVAMVFGAATWDRHGYTVRAMAYDAPGTMGVLARRLKTHERTLIPLPEDTAHSLPQWAAFSLRYVTAWSNWRVAHACWRAQLEEVPPHEMQVFAWGGGVAFAELQLARRLGCQCAMVASRDDRLRRIEAEGIQAIDRRAFGALGFEADRYAEDKGYRRRYQESEQAFLDLVGERTGGQGVSVFVDNIGTPVIRATLKALARCGVVATAGWKLGMNVTLLRAIECINRHTHVHTHYARYQEGQAAVEFAERTGWMAPAPDRVYRWEELPELAEDFACGRLDTFFPVFAVNGE